MKPEERSKEIEKGHQEKPQGRLTFLTDEEMEKGGKAFVELIKAREKLIAEVKKTKGISDSDH